MRKLILAMIVVCNGTLIAQAPTPQTIQGLGTITFPTSTKSAAAQTAFIRGVLLLHIFEYPDAAASFREAQRLDPDFAMAYWGEAMTYTHAVWNEQNVAGARATLLRLGSNTAARQSRAGTKREAMYLMAVETLYGDGPKAKRDTLYSEAMHQVLLAYPSDDEARAFYALSLIGLSQGVRNVPTYLQAAAIAESVYKRNPQHPGAAHYWIHGMDDPDHGKDALRAARALSGIAPDAGHSQHMTSHIFLALGMWDDVVAANESAIRVVNAKRAARGLGPSVCGHYPSWLSYGYQQQGRLSAAERAFTACWEGARASGAGKPPFQAADDPMRGAVVAMWARLMLDQRPSPHPIGWVMFPGDDPGTLVEYHFVLAYLSALDGKLPAARTALLAFDSAASARQAQLSAAADPDPESVEEEKGMRVLRLEIVGLIAIKSGSVDSGLALLARATVIEDSTASAFGPPSIDEPSHEALGEQLLAAGKPKEAMVEFRASLARAPRRTPALLGLARSASRAGDAATAAQTYATLAEIWRNADPDLPALAEVRAGAIAATTSHQ